MTTSEWIVNILLLVLTVALSAFFSGSEMAYTALNRMRLDKLVEEKPRSSRVLAAWISDRFDTALSTILVGNNFVNIYSSSIATVLCVELGRHFGWTESLSGTISTVVMTVIVLIFGEIMPKVIAKEYALPISIAIAWPLRVLMILLTPITVIVMGIVNLCAKLWSRHTTDDLPGATEEEISTIIDTVEEEGVIDEEAGELLQSALDFHETTAHEILTPRINMLAIDVDDTVEEITATLLESRYSRIPVYEGSIDHVIGVLHLNRFFKELVDRPDPDIRGMLMQPYFVHKTMKLPALLSEMRARQTHIAIVLDEYGGTMGLVTMEDILEQIVGDIWDESDEIETEFTALPDGSFEAAGTMNVYDLFEELDVSDRNYESECTTVGGFVTELLESDPHVGDEAEFENILFRVSEMNENCVTKVVAVLREKPADEDEEA